MAVLSVILPELCDDFRDVGEPSCDVQTDSTVEHPFPVCKRLLAPAGYDGPIPNGVGRNLPDSACGNDSLRRL